MGCGTGTNALFLARHGFQVLGVDASRRAVALARQRAGEAGVSCDFRVGDVSRLDRIAPAGPFDLAIDMGCFHGLTFSAQRRYARGLADRMTREGVYLLYAFCPRRRGWRRIGVSPDDVGSLFADGFLVEKVKAGVDTDSGHASAWYTLRRT